ncbi:unnamed protein product [Symbiodinium sp. KB8]|nr:unnamed protein product [Symbiodinium sp. KB8]
MKHNSGLWPSPEESCFSLQEQFSSAPSGCARSRAACAEFLAAPPPVEARASRFLQSGLASSSSFGDFGHKRRPDGGVKDADGGAIIEETTCPKLGLAENEHGTGLKAGHLQLGLSAIFVLGIPIGIVGGCLYQVYERIAKARAKAAKEAEAAKASVLDCGAERCHCRKLLRTLR